MNTRYTVFSDGRRTGESEHSLHIILDKYCAPFKSSIWDNWTSIWDNWTSILPINISLYLDNICSNLREYVTIMSK